MIEYRLFEINDVPNVIEMWRVTNGVKMHNNGEDSEEGICRCLKHNKGFSYIAEDNGSIVGAVLNGQDGRRGYVYHLVVKEEYRKHGIAKHLLKITEDTMRGAGIHKLALFVLNDNKDAQDVYIKLDWQEVTEAKTFAKII